MFWVAGEARAVGIRAICGSISSAVFATFARGKSDRQGRQARQVGCFSLACLAPLAAKILAAGIACVASANRRIVRHRLLDCNAARSTGWRALEVSSRLLARNAARRFEPYGVSAEPWFEPVMTTSSKSLFAFSSALTTWNVEEGSTLLSISPTMSISFPSSFDALTALELAA